MSTVAAPPISEAERERQDARRVLKGAQAVLAERGFCQWSAEQIIGWGPGAVHPGWSVDPCESPLSLICGFNNAPGRTVDDLTRILDNALQEV